LKLILFELLVDVLATAVSFPFNSSVRKNDRMLFDHIDSNC